MVCEKKYIRRADLKFGQNRLKYKNQVDNLQFEYL